MKTAKIFLFTFLLVGIFFPKTSEAATHYVGTYCGHDGRPQFDAILVRDCNKFRSQFTATVGQHSYYNVQYYYGYRFLFEGSNNSYVDYMDLAFFSGHGSAYAFYNRDGGTSFYNTGDGWGNGWLKWIGFFTCQTIMTPNKDGNAWSAYNNTSEGVHLMVGFNVNSAFADTNLPNNWAYYMKTGDYVWRSWFRAVNSARGYYGSVYQGGWPGTASAVMWTDQYGNPSLDPYYDRLSSYSNKPSSGASINFLYQY